MGKANRDIRVKAMEKGVYLWQIAERLGMYDTNFSRLLRKELGEDEKYKIFKVIDELANERR